MIRLTFDRNRTNLQGTVHLPASKSIAARALVLHHLASKEPAESNIPNLPECDDTRVIRRALTDASANGTINIEGAGTAMRFLTALFVCQPGSDIILTGNNRMQQRPIGTLVEALRELGADISYEGKEGFPPLHIRGKELSGDSLTMDGSISSQYISAMLMIAPLIKPASEGNPPFRLTLEGKIVSAPYIDMTCALMEHYGIEVAWEEETGSLLVPRGSYVDKPLTIEGDWSAASYWYAMQTLAMKLCIPYSVKLEGLTYTDCIQGDSICVELLDPQLLMRGEISIDCSDTPDLIPTLAVAYFLLDTPFRIYGAENLRIKETDRIDALACELGKLGCALKVESRNWNDKAEEILIWDGTKNEAYDNGKCARISTYGDHRMAMSFAPAVLRFGQIEIEHPEVVNKSYPAFWDDLKSVGIGIDILPDTEANPSENEP